MIFQSSIFQRIFLSCEYVNLLCRRTQNALFMEWSHRFSYLYADIIISILMSLFLSIIFGNDHNRLMQFIACNVSVTHVMIYDNYMVLFHYYLLLLLLIFNGGNIIFNSRICLWCYCRVLHLLTPYNNTWNDYIEL